MHADKIDEFHIYIPWLFIWESDVQVLTKLPDKNRRREKLTINI